jgi:hypothetical protein
LDGYADLVVADPTRHVEGQANAGAIRVIYGSPSGLTATVSRLWTQNDLSGATAEENDFFGWSSTAADFDSDGFSDLAVGAPGEDASAGAVHVLYGSRTGLSTAGSQTWDQNQQGVRGSAERDDQFGSALAAANVGKGPAADLAVGIVGESVRGRDGAGAVQILYGSAGGLTATDSQLWSQASSNVKGAAERFDSFGTSLVAAPFAGRVYADLAIGVPYETTGSVERAGAVHVLYGSAEGLTARGNQIWTQDSRGIRGRSEVLDHFGSTLAAGHFAGRIYADLAIGTPRKDRVDGEGVGSVNIIYGSAHGLTASGDQVWGQDSPGIPGQHSGGDEFGGSLMSGNFGRDTGGHTYTDLAIGVPGEGTNEEAERGEGAINVIYGSAKGLTAAGSQYWDEASPGIPGRRVDGDRFGTTLVAGDYGREDAGRAYADLAIGVRGRSRGEVRVIYGTSQGLAAAGVQTWAP